MASGPTTSLEIDGETVETVSDFIFGYFGHVMQRVDSLEKTLMLGGMDWGQKEMGMTEDEMAGWHH